MEEGGAVGEWRRTVIQKFRLPNEKWLMAFRQSDRVKREC